MRSGHIIILLAGMMACTNPVRAESLILSLSSSHVAITSTYIGTDMVVFGVIERESTHGRRRNARPPFANGLVTNAEEFGDAGSRLLAVRHL
jgi:hypothetical protein